MNECLTALSGPRIFRALMKRALGVLFAVGLTAACSRGGSAPVAPVAAPPADAPAVQAIVSTNPADRPVEVAAPAAPAPQAPRAARTDTIRESAFLDSLHAASADTTHPPIVEVAPEVVRREAAALFGHPDGAPANPTWDIDVASYAQHERVQYWMGYFTGRSRWHFERYIERAGRYDSMIRTRLGAAGLPQDMIYLAMIESGFAQSIRSRAGAVGLWQFMPETGRRYGLAVDNWVDERRDPFLATDAAIRFLTELNHRFGSWYLAAAAYNSGPGKIQRGLARGDYGALNGNDAYFAMADGTFLRRETRDYVPKLIAAALLAKEPERYGFTGLEAWSPLMYDSIQTGYAVGLDVLARLASASREEMEELNPQFIRGVTPPDRSYWVKVPSGTAETVSARLADLPASQRVTVIVHIVSRGETLSHLALRYGVTSSDIRTANHLSSTRLARGQRLVIPTSSSRLRSQSGAAPRASRSPRATSGTRTSTRSRTTTTASRRVHIVRAGESPYSIATAFKVPVESLLGANGLSRRSVIHPGQSLRIPD